MALFFLAVFTVAPPWRQPPLSVLVLTLFGADGIRLSSGISNHAHFTAVCKEQLTTINDSLRSQLSYYPLPSPASGFTFRFDPALGAFSRASENFGPIYSQRADTTGKGKFTFGFSYSRFTFDPVDGKDLSNGDLQVTFLHEPTCPRRPARSKPTPSPPRSRPASPPT